MTSRPVRGALVVLGVVAVVVGGVFAGQGAGVIPGSFMTGSRTWLLVGIVLVVAGVAAVVAGLRGGRAR